MAAGIFLIVWGMFFAGIGSFFLYTSLTDPTSLSGDGDPALISTIFIIIGTGAVIFGFYACLHDKKDQALRGKAKNELMIRQDHNRVLVRWISVVLQMLIPVLFIIWFFTGSSVFDW